MKNLDQVIGALVEIERRVAVVEASNIDFQLKVAKQQRIIDRQQQTIQKLQRLLPKPEVPLTPKQEAVLQQLGAIQGNDEADRKLAEEQLGHLQGERASKILVDWIKKFLKGKKWGILMDSGIVAAPLWHNRLCRFVAYNEAGDREFITSFAEIPNLRLAERKDRRFRR